MNLFTRLNLPWKLWPNTQSSKHSHRSTTHSFVHSIQGQQFILILSNEKGSFNYIPHQYSLSHTLWRTLHWRFLRILSIRKLYSRWSANSLETAVLFSRVTNNHSFVCLKLDLFNLDTFSLLNHWEWFRLLFIIKNNLRSSNFLLVVRLVGLLLKWLNIYHINWIHLIIWSLIV